VRWFEITSERAESGPKARENSLAPGGTAANSSEVDAAALARQLRRKIKGEVRFTDGDRALYATDGSNYRQVPIGVIVPRDAEDVINTFALCRQFGAPQKFKHAATACSQFTANQSFRFSTEFLPPTGSKRRSERITEEPITPYYSSILRHDERDEESILHSPHGVNK
jgi:hypothetical protein